MAFSPTNFFRKAPHMNSMNKSNQGRRKCVQVGGAGFQHATTTQPEPPEPVHFARNRSRSRSRWNILLGAGAIAGIISGAGAGAVPNLHGSASLILGH